MQYDDSAQRVFNCPELWNIVIANLDVSHKGFAAMKNMMMMHNGSVEFVMQQLESAPWVFYLKGVAVVSEKKELFRVRPVTAFDLTMLLELIDEYQTIEDVVADLLGIIDTFEQDSDYKGIHDDMIYGLSNGKKKQHFAMFTTILAKFAGNRGIEKVAFAVLDDMYHGLMRELEPIPLGGVETVLAVACMCRSDRTHCTVQASLKFLSTLCETDLEYTRAVLKKHNHDIMLIVFDIQKNFFEHIGVLQICDTLCGVFLFWWTVPAHSVGVNPSSIILGCMQEFPGNVNRQIIGCRQLYNLCHYNGRTSTYGPDIMEAVVYFLQQIQYERVHNRMPNDYRDWYLWTFVFEVMRNAETYSACINLFSVAFLQTALVCNFAIYADAHKLDLTATPRMDRVRHVDCVHYISSLLQGILKARPALVAAFVRQDAISVLVRIGHHHIQKELLYIYKGRCDGQTVCLDLLLDMLLDQHVHGTGLFTKTIFGDRRVQRKFPVGIISTDHMCTTIPILLVTSLHFFDKSTHGGADYIRYTRVWVTWIDKTLCLLSRASNEGKLVCVDMMEYIERFFTFVLAFIAGVQRDVPEVAGVALAAAVAHCDNFIVNVYRVSSVDCSYQYYSLWMSRAMDEYIQASSLYRHSASTFKPDTEKLTAALTPSPL